MIFGVPGHIDMMRDGTKTQTRRTNRGVYQVGRDYAVQSKRGVKAEEDIRIAIEEIWEEWLVYGGMHSYQILPRNAQAEGGYSVEKFEKLFRDINTKWDGQKRWAFRFHVITVQKATKKTPYYIRTRVLTDIGQASMCWEFPGRAGTFDTEEAIKIGDALCQYIVDKIEKEKKKCVKKEKRTSLSTSDN